MTVEPTAFVAAMSDHWQRNLHNVTSPALEAVWHQMAYTFNRQIEAYGTPDGERWKVLQPATGTGKSQGLAVYCSMLSLADHPGVLIVTRLKAQADEIASTINRLAGNPTTAVAFHGDATVSIESLSEFPMVIITHRAYEIGLDAINRGIAAAPKWERYHTWQDGRRKLVVVDEALDIIEEAQIDLERVRFIHGVIPFEIAERYPEQMKAIEIVRDILVQIARMAHQREGQVVETERVLWSGSLSLPQQYDMTELRRELRSIRLDMKLLNRNDKQQNKKMIQQYDTILRDIQATLENWNWYAKKLGSHTINTARLIVPDDINGAIILDATASSNLIYQLFDYKVDVIPTPSDARSYTNVTLHVSFGHTVGKTSMVKAAKEEAPRLVENLKQALGRDRKVFVCCHQWVEPHLVQYDHGFAALGVGHWNAVDGRNDWSDYDSAVIFGLPYRDKTWSANTYMALRGLQDNAWLNAEGNRPFKQYRDVRYSLEVGQLVVSVVQAINRVRCRRVVDEAGNCQPTDVFLLLPNDKTGRELLEGIKVEMPGVVVEGWSYTAIKRQPRKSHHEEALLRYAKIMRDGRKAITDIMRELGVSRSTFMWVVERAKDATTNFHQRLAELGVRYEVERCGSTQRGYFVKG